MIALQIIVSTLFFAQYVLSQSNYSKLNFTCTYDGAEAIMIANLNGFMNEMKGASLGDSVNQEEGIDIRNITVKNFTHSPPTYGLEFSVHFSDTILIAEIGVFNFEIGFKLNSTFDVLYIATTVGIGVKVQAIYTGDSLVFQVQNPYHFGMRFGEKVISSIPEIEKNFDHSDILLTLLYKKIQDVLQTWFNQGVDKWLKPYQLPGLPLTINLTPIRNIDTSYGILTLFLDGTILNTLHPGLPPKVANIGIPTEKAKYSSGFSEDLVNSAFEELFVIGFFNKTFDTYPIRVGVVINMTSSLFQNILPNITQNFGLNSPMKVNCRDIDGPPPYVIFPKPLLVFKGNSEFIVIFPGKCEVFVKNNSEWESLLIAKGTLHMNVTGFMDNERLKVQVYQLNVSDITIVNTTVKDLTDQILIQNMNAFLRDNVPQWDQEIPIPMFPDFNLSNSTVTVNYEYIQLLQDKYLTPVS